MRTFLLTTNGDQHRQFYAMVDDDGIVVKNDVNDSYNGRKWSDVELAWITNFKEWKSSIQDNEYPSIEELTP